MSRRGEPQRLGLSGYGTASSVPGGLFGEAPEAQFRERMDGRAGGRGNSSSLEGGIFGGGQPSRPTRAERQFNPTDSSVPGGIFGGGHWAGDQGERLGPQGFQRQLAASRDAFDGAAGGKSTNAGQVRDGHFRKGTWPAARIESARGGEDDFLDRLSRAEARDGDAEGHHPLTLTHTHTRTRTRARAHAR